MHRDTITTPPSSASTSGEPFQLAVVPATSPRGTSIIPRRSSPSSTRPSCPTTNSNGSSSMSGSRPGKPRASFSRTALRITRLRPQGQRTLQGRVQGRHLQVRRQPHPPPPQRQAAPHPHRRDPDRRPLPEEGGRLEERAVFGERASRPIKRWSNSPPSPPAPTAAPLTRPTRTRLRETYEQRLKETGDPRTAALDAIKLILCSPSFLYLREITGDGQTRLHPYDLATRLSYALWAAPPDETLFAAAAAGRLDDSAGLEKEALRLLAHVRVEGFIRGFTDQLAEPAGTRPDAAASRSRQGLLCENLPEAMKTEVPPLLPRSPRPRPPVSRFLVADYTFADKRLAKLYSLPRPRPSALPTASSASVSRT